MKVGRVLMMWLELILQSSLATEKHVTVNQMQDWHGIFTAEVRVDFLFSFLRLKGENQQLIDYRKKLDELRCWLENAENALDTRFTFNHEENLRELQVRSVCVCVCMHVCFMQSSRTCLSERGIFTV